MLCCMSCTQIWAKSIPWLLRPSLSYQVWHFCCPEKNWFCAQKTEKRYEKVENDWTVDLFKKNGFVLSMIFLQSNQVVVPRHRANTSIVPSEDERFESLDPDEFSTKFHEDFELWILWICASLIFRFFSVQGGDSSFCRALRSSTCWLFEMKTALKEPFRCSKVGRRVQREHIVTLWHWKSSFLNVPHQSYSMSFHLRRTSRLPAE